MTAIIEANEEMTIIIIILVLHENTWSCLFITTTNTSQGYVIVEIMFSGSEVKITTIKLNTATTWM
ncbi:MAG: hypothetical protein DRJ03_31625 [Chloroflexi bacterium]|nr:MAG: hypothetical protein DRJ03_31625 [Chloroflexota bacterium]